MYLPIPFLKFIEV
jgi:hypothetical protein